MGLGGEEKRDMDIYLTAIRWRGRLGNVGLGWRPPLTLFFFIGSRDYWRTDREGRLAFEPLLVNFYHIGHEQLNFSTNTRKKIRPI
jgi:hypothetical protein